MSRGRRRSQKDPNFKVRPQRATKSGFVSEGTSKYDRRAVFRRDKRQCAYCGTTKGTFQVDHVIPVWDRGTTEMRNLVLACPSCNAEKGASVSERWLLPLLEHPTYQIRITAADEINRLREETMIDHGRAG